MPELSDPSLEPKQSSSSGRQAANPGPDSFQKLKETAPCSTCKGRNNILPGLRYFSGELGHRCVRSADEGKNAMQSLNLGNLGGAEQFIFLFSLFCFLISLLSLGPKKASHQSPYPGRWVPNPLSTLATPWSYLDLFSNGGHTIVVGWN